MVRQAVEAGHWLAQGYGPCFQVGPGIRLVLSGDAQAAQAFYGGPTGEQEWQWWTRQWKWSERKAEVFYLTLEVEEVVRRVASGPDHR